MCFATVKTATKWEEDMEHFGRDGDSMLLETDPRVSQESIQKLWTIKNIDEDIIEKARDAARINGMKISSWVGARLKYAAESELSGANGGNVENNLIVEIKNIVQKISEFQSEKINRIENDLNSVLKAQHSMLSALLEQSSK